MVLLNICTYLYIHYVFRFCHILEERLWFFDFFCVCVCVSIFIVSVQFSLFFCSEHVQC